MKFFKLRFFLFFFIFFEIEKIISANEVLAPVSVMSLLDSSIQINHKKSDSLTNFEENILMELERLLNPLALIEINSNSKELIFLLDTIMINKLYLKFVKKDILQEFIKFSFAFIEQVTFFTEEIDESVKNFYINSYFILLTLIINNCERDDIIKQIFTLLMQYRNNNKILLFGNYYSDILFDAVLSKISSDDFLYEISLNFKGDSSFMWLSNERLNSEKNLLTLISRVINDLKKSDIKMPTMDYPYFKKSTYEYPDLKEREIQIMLQYSLMKLKDELLKARTLSSCNEILIELNGILVKCESLIYSKKLIKNTIELKDLCIERFQVISFLERQISFFNSLNFTYEQVRDFILNQSLYEQKNIAFTFLTDSQERKDLLKQLREYVDGIYNLKEILDGNNLSIQDLKYYLFKSRYYNSLNDIVKVLSKAKENGKVNEKLRPVVKFKKQGIKHYFNNNSIHIRRVKFTLNNEISSKGYYVHEYLNRIELHYNEMQCTFPIDENGDFINIDSKERCFDATKNRVRSLHEKYAYSINMTNYAKKLFYLNIIDLMGIDSAIYSDNDIQYVINFIFNLLKKCNSDDNRLLTWKKHFPKKLHYIFDILEINSLIKASSLEEGIAINQKENWKILIDYILENKVEYNNTSKNLLKVSSLMLEFGLNNDDLLYYTFISKSYKSVSELIHFMEENNESTIRRTLSRIWFYKNYGHKQNFTFDEIVSRNISFSIGSDLPHHHFYLTEYLDKIVLSFFNEELILPIYKTGFLKINDNTRISFVLAHNSLKGQIRVSLLEQSRELFVKHLRKTILLNNSNVKDDDIWLAFSILKDFSLLKSSNKEAILKSILPKKCYHAILDIVNTGFDKFFSEGIFSLEYIQEWSLIIESLAKSEKGLIKYLKSLNRDTMLKENFIRAMSVRGITGDDLRMHYNTLPYNKDQKPFEIDIFEKGDLLKFIKRVENNKYNGLSFKEFTINKNQEKATCKIRGRQFAIAKGILLKYPGIKFFLEESLDTLKLKTEYENKIYMIHEFDISNGILLIPGENEISFLQREKGSQITLTAFLSEKIKNGTLFNNEIQNEELNYTNEGKSLLKEIKVEIVDDDVRWMMNNNFTKDSISKFVLAGITKSDIIRYSVQYMPNLISMLTNSDDYNWDANSSYLIFKILQLKKGLITKFKKNDNNNFFADIGKQRFILSGYLIEEFGGPDNFSITRYLDKVTFEVKGEIKLVFIIDDNGKLIDNLNGVKKPVSDLSVLNFMKDNINIDMYIRHNVLSAA